MSAISLIPSKTRSYKKLLRKKAQNGDQTFGYQREMRDSVLDAFNLHDSVMCQLPTSTGKTHMLAAVVSEYAKGKTVWVVTHHRELSTVNKLLKKNPT